MKILLTNDDGIHAPGLVVLEQIARPFQIGRGLCLDSWNNLQRIIRRPLCAKQALTFLAKAESAAPNRSREAHAHSDRYRLARNDYHIRDLRLVSFFGRTDDMGTHGESGHVQRLPLADFPDQVLIDVDIDTVGLRFDGESTGY